MIVWIILRQEGFRTTVVSLWDTREAAQAELDRLSRCMQVDVKETSLGSYQVGMQLYHIDRHQVNLTNRIRKGEKCRVHRTS